MDVFSSSAASDNVDFNYEINRLRDQHYQTVTDAENAVRNDIGAMNEDTTQNIDLLGSTSTSRVVNVGAVPSPRSAQPRSAATALSA